MTTQVVAGKYVLGNKDGAQALLRDHHVYVEGSKIEAVIRDAPAAGMPLVHYEHGPVTPGFVNLQPVCDPVRNLVQKGNVGDLVFTMNHGRPVVRDGRLLTMDEDAVLLTL